MPPNYEWVASDDEERLLGYESDQEFVQDCKDEPEQVESESGSDEFDASGYYVGKKVKPGVYDFSDSSVPFSGFGIVLKQTQTQTETDSDSDSSSYDSDATSKPSSFRYKHDPSGKSMANNFDSGAETETRKRKFLAVRDFPQGCGVGSANLMAAERLQSPSFKRRNVWYKRDFPVGCGR